LNYYATANLLEIIEDIVEIDAKMRFAAIVDLNGNVLEAIMRTGKTSMKTQKEEEHFCKQVAQRRKMRKDFDSNLGKVRYVHVEREKVTQIVVYAKRKSIYFTMEPEVGIEKKLRIINRVKKMVANL